MADIGEATTLAYAEFRSITAMVDNRAGRRQGVERGVKVTGTLETLCGGVRNKIIEVAEAATVVI